MAHVSSLTAPPATLTERPNEGEYYCTDRDLYRVEEVHGVFALLEDCRTEMVLELALSEVLAMKRVQPAAA